jgi:hypothetical protein
MIDLKKLEEKDVVFNNKPLTDKEEQDFRNFLKFRSTNLKKATEPKSLKPARQ